MHYSEPKMLTSGPKHHFFGYYGISPWNATGKYFLCLETDFHDHMPRLGEKARIILGDLHKCSWEVLTEVFAWNFQQGCMLHWLPSAPDRKFIYNDLDFSQIDDKGNPKPIAKIYDIVSGEIKILPRSINALAHSHDWALCLNFGRLRANREVISYPTAYNNSPGSHPDSDGIFFMDLNTGKERLIVDLQSIWNGHQLTREISELAEPDDRIPEMWIDHVGFNPSDSRLFFLARYAPLFGAFTTSMWTCDIEGQDRFLLVDYGQGLSHFEWWDDSNIIVTKKYLPDTACSYVVLTDKKENRNKDKMEEPRVIAPHGLIRDGHPTLNPDHTILATDCYPFKNMRFIYLVDLKTMPEQVYEVGSFENISFKSNSLRCDPHPRWNRDGTALCYDGLTKDGTRQIFLIENIHE